MNLTQKWFQAARIFFLLVVIPVLFVSPAYGQINVGRVILDVVQNAELGGELSYTLRTLTFTGSKRAVLVAPDGTRLGGGPTLARQITVPTFSEFSSRFFGEWTLEEELFGPPSPLSEYGFNFSPFTLDDVFHETPVITTPDDEATVSPSFIVAWEYLSGAIRPGGGVELNSGFGAVDILNIPTPDRQARLDVDLDTLGSTPLVFRTSSRDSLNDYVSEITPLSGPAPTTYSIVSEFSSLSLRTTVHVVPEPTALGFVLIAAATFAAGIRSRTR